MLVLCAVPVYLQNHWEMYPKLPQIEVILYFVLWLSLYGWAIIKVGVLSFSKGKLLNVFCCMLWTLYA